MAAVASILEPGSGWRHVLVDSNGGVANLCGSSDIGSVENKQDTHAHSAAARAYDIHAVAAAKGCIHP